MSCLLIHKKEITPSFVLSLIDIYKRECQLPAYNYTQEVLG